MKKLSAVKHDLIIRILPIMAEEEELGWQPIVAEGMRTKAQEREKVRKGYSQTMHSKHLTGDAVDIVDKRYGWDGKASNLHFKFWRDQQKAVHHHQEGLTSGADWIHFKDVAHIQLNEGSR